MARPLSGPGLKLAWEEHEKKGDDLHQLLVAQLELDRQFKHGVNLVCAGWPANLFKVGICIAPCLALALGLPRMALSSSLILNGYPGHRLAGHAISHLKRLTRPQTPGGSSPRVHCPARGSARMTFLKHNALLSGLGVF